MVAKQKSTPHKVIIMAGLEHQLLSNRPKRIIRVEKTKMEYGPEAGWWAVYIGASLVAVVSDEPTADALVTRFQNDHSAALNAIDRS